MGKKWAEHVQNHTNLYKLRQVKSGHKKRCDNVLGYHALSYENTKEGIMSPLLYRLSHGFISSYGCMAKFVLERVPLHNPLLSVQILVGEAVLRTL